MSPLARPGLNVTSMADLLDQLGGLNARRVLLLTRFRKATVADVNRINEQENRRCELIDGVLVEKLMGVRESILVCELIARIRPYVRQYDLGLVTGPDGAIQLAPGLVRYPDAAYFAWEQLPNRKLPREKIPDLAPRLAIEALSESNTPQEMRNKIKDYFFAGVKLVWIFDLRTRSVQVFTAPDESLTLREKDTLEGGDVLPGFRLSLREFFAEIPEVEEEPPARGKKKRR